jgi:hypothetical protein
MECLLACELLRRDECVREVMARQKHLRRQAVATANEDDSGRLVGSSDRMGI